MSAPAPTLPAARPTYLNALVAVTCLVTLGVFALWFVDRRAERQQAESQRAALAPVLKSASQAQQDEQWIKQAILANRAILGMNRYEVRAAKGAPRTVLRQEELPELVQAAGAIEGWTFDNGSGVPDSVLFNRLGLTIYSSDVVDRAEQPGNAVRR